MRDIRTKIASTAIAAALIFSPTAAVASTYNTATTSSSTAWLTLSSLTPAGATALAGAGANAPSAATLAAAQSTVAYDERRANPLPLPVIAVLLAVLGTAIYIAFLEDHDGDAHFGTSPD